MKYHYKDPAGHEVGPITEEELHAFRAGGLLVDETLVKPTDTETWTSYATKFGPMPQANAGTQVGARLTRKQWFAIGAVASLVAIFYGGSIAADAMLNRTPPSAVVTPGIAATTPQQFSQFDVNKTEVVFDHSGALVSGHAQVTLTLKEPLYAKDDFLRRAVEKGDDHKAFDAAAARRDKLPPSLAPVIPKIPASQLYAEAKPRGYLVTVTASLSASKQSRQWTFTDCLTAWSGRRGWVLGRTDWPPLPQEFGGLVPRGQLPRNAVSLNEEAGQNVLRKLLANRKAFIADVRAAEEVVTQQEAMKAQRAEKMKVFESFLVTVSAEKDSAQFVVPEVRIAMMKIDPGIFTMGSPENEPGHQKDEGHQTTVTITQPFWLGKTEVTHAQWRTLMGTDLAGQVRRALTDDTFYQRGDQRRTLRDHLGMRRNDDPAKQLGNTSDDVPMHYVSWDEAMAYCRALTVRERAAGRLPMNYEYRLPTEAEWEYACRAGSPKATYAGDITIVGKNNAPILDAIAWYGGNSGAGYSGIGWDTAKWPEKQYNMGRAAARNVGEKTPNSWGLHDMLGNVWEWCLDWVADYPGGSVSDYDGPSQGKTRVCRGGSWNSPATAERAAQRADDMPTWRSNSLGFRVALGRVTPAMAAKLKPREPEKPPGGEQLLSAFAGTFAGVWKGSNGVAFQRILTINPDLTTGSDNIEQPSGERLPMRVAARFEDGAFKARNETIQGKYTADNMTVTLTEDRSAINIDLIDDNGTSGSGHLYRVPDARLQSGFVGTFSGKWREVNGSTYQRTISINPDLSTGLDTIGTQKGRIALKITAHVEGNTLKARNESLGTYTADNMTITLSSDGSAIDISLVDDKGNRGSGRLTRVR